MHARHFIACGFVFGLVALLASACVATVDSTAPEEDIGTDAEAQDAFKFVVCKGNHFACMAECARAGVTCGPAASHPQKPNVGLGYLFGCVTTGRRACAFRYPNGDKCFYPKDEGPAFCTG